MKRSSFPAVSNDTSDDQQLWHECHQHLLSSRGLRYFLYLLTHYDAKIRSLCKLFVNNLPQRFLAVSGREYWSVMLSGIGHLKRIKRRKCFQSHSQETKIVEKRRPGVSNFQSHFYDTESFFLCCKNNIRITLQTNQFPVNFVNMSHEDVFESRKDRKPTKI